MGKALPLPIVNLHAAGIDVGSRSHFVAIDQNKENVRTFGIGTKDQRSLLCIYVVLRSRQSLWKAPGPGPTGRPFFVLFRKPDWQCCSSEEARPNMCRVARPMCWTACGFRSCMLWVYCRGAFCWAILSKSCALIITTAAYGGANFQVYPQNTKGTPADEYPAGCGHPWHYQ